MPVIGTAGHVDHGKSTLVLTLTGRDPDRWAEEKTRGLTIDLGFAWTALPSGVEVSFVDVPGHEQFMKNMLAGIESVDIALLVVAADEGWMPQSEEHLVVLDLLGAAGGGGAHQDGSCRRRAGRARHPGDRGTPGRHLAGRERR
jgi:selenocysteine-specific elongation factor